jgi:alpha-tubulin suppressor-like RCC1 family protein
LVFTFGGFPGAVQMDAGDHHVCALDATGKAYCWGNNHNGQLGIGVNGFASEPIAVVGGLTFTSIGAGTMGSCGTTADGMFCWGLPIASLNGSNLGHTSPLRVYSATGLAPVGVTVGYTGVCALWIQGDYRETNCWGRNWEGQTGSPAAPFTALGQGPMFLTATAQRVVTQSTFTCVDQPGPSVQCWGAGGSGQLGNGTNVTTHAPFTVTAAGGTAVALRSVTTGQYHACALDLNGAAYCWGNGNYGQLGNGLPPSGGAGISSNRATPVTGGLTFRAIAAGERHTCGIGTNNKIYCWGSNYHGELGTMYKSPGQPYTNGWVADPVQALDPI